MHKLGENDFPKYLKWTGATKHDIQYIMFY